MNTIQQLISRLFRKPSLEQIIDSQLNEARLLLLDAQRQHELHGCNVVGLEQTVLRLETIQKNNDVLGRGMQ